MTPLHSISLNRDIMHGPSYIKKVSLKWATSFD